MMPVMNINPGTKIKARIDLNYIKISFWKYGREAVLHHSGGFLKGNEFKVIEVNKVPNNLWVRLENINSWPVKYIKVTGEELSANFEMA